MSVLERQIKKMKRQAYRAGGICCTCSYRTIYSSNSCKDWQDGRSLGRRREQPLHRNRTARDQRTQAVALDRTGEQGGAWKSALPARKAKGKLGGSKW